MLASKKRFAIFIVAECATVGFTSRAFAATVVTPFGPVDESCVHTVPNGGKIDVQTGDVSLNGTVVDQFAACSVSWNLHLPSIAQRASSTAPTQSGKSQPPSGGGWYTWSDSQAPSISGTVYPFDLFDSDWNVPTSPNPPAGDSPLEYFWTGLQNNQGLSSEGTGCGSNIMLIQPVLQWGSNGSFGGAYWTIASWAVWGCNSSCGSCSVGRSGDEQVYEYDQIFGEVLQTASNLDEWEIYIEDTTTGAFTTEYLQSIPNSWPKFESAQGGVLENYISQCSDLSADDTITFSLDGACVAKPSWNSYDEVGYSGANLLSWGGWNIASPSPSCSWNAYPVTNSATTLTWSE